MKICCKCKKEKEDEDFYIRKSAKDGLRSTCIACDLDDNNQYYKNNRTRMLDKNRKFALKNPEYFKNYRIEKEKERKEYNKRYSESHRAEIQRKKKERKKLDINYKLACNLRSRITHAVKGSQKRGSAVKDLGCSIDFFKKYIESKFEPGMSWENWKINGWHIDHIVPLGLFNLSNREQFLQACHYTNLQPLWAEENLKKNKTLV